MAVTVNSVPEPSFSRRPVGVTPSAIVVSATSSAWSVMVIDVEVTPMGVPADPADPDTEMVSSRSSMLSGCTVKLYVIDALIWSAPMVRSTVSSLRVLGAPKSSVGVAVPGSGWTMLLMSIVGTLSVTVVASARVPPSRVAVTRTWVTVEPSPSAGSASVVWLVLSVRLVDATSSLFSTVAAGFTLRSVLVPSRAVLLATPITKMVSSTSVSWSSTGVIIQPVALPVRLSPGMVMVDGRSVWVKSSPSLQGSVVQSVAEPWARFSVTTVSALRLTMPWRVGGHRHRLLAAGLIDAGGSPCSAGSWWTRCRWDRR